LINAKNFWFWFGGIWAGVGAVFLIVGIAVGIYRARIDEQLASHGRETEGIVLTKEISGSSNGDARTFRVTFRFADEVGQNVFGAAEIEPAAWDALAERGPIRVTYVPDAPRTHRVPDERDPKGVISWVFALVGAALAAIGSFVVVTARRKSRREAALRQHGAVATATVLEVAPGNLRINGVPQLRLRYRFHDSRGGAHEGSCALSPDEAQDWQPGRTGKVRYDAQNPRSHLWTGA